MPLIAYVAKVKNGRTYLARMKDKPSIVIDSHVPMPEGRFAQTGLYQTLRQTFKDMKDGQSFVWSENVMIYRAAKEAGVIIKSRKLNGEGYRVWRVRLANNLPTPSASRLPCP